MAPRRNWSCLIAASGLRRLGTDCWQSGNAGHSDLTTDLGRGTPHLVAHSRDRWCDMELEGRVADPAVVEAAQQVIRTVPDPASFLDAGSSDVRQKNAPSYTAMVPSVANVPSKPGVEK